MIEHLKNNLLPMLLVAIGVASGYAYGWRSGWNSAVKESREARAIELALTKPKADTDTAAAIVVAQDFIRRSSARPELVKMGKFIALPCVGVHLEWTADGTEAVQKREVYVANGSVVLVNPPLK